MSPLESSPWQIVTALFMFGVGFVTTQLVRTGFKLSQKQAAQLYLWHTFYCLAYMMFVVADGGDAVRYYVQGSTAELTLDLGTTAVKSIASVFIHAFDLSFLGLFLAFNIIGSIGLLAFAGSLKYAVDGVRGRLRWQAAALAFMPSASFWSSAIGKDSIAFLGVNLALWSALDLDRRKLLMSGGIAIVGIVRPHIALALLVALAFGILLSRRTRAATRLVVFALALAAGVVAAPLALEYVGLSALTDSSELAEYIEQRQTKNLEGAASIDIADMPLPMQVFTYLYRPLPFEAHSVTQMLSALENVLLLAFTALTCPALLSGTARIGESRMFIWFYVLGATILLSMVTANLGIAVRQKWMILPFLSYLLVSAAAGQYARQHHRKTERERFRAPRPMPVAHDVHEGQIGPNEYRR